MQRATFCLTVDNLGSARVVGLGLTGRPDPDEPGLRDGLPRALDLFERTGAKGTFFLEGWNALHHPEAVEAIAAAGHEIGAHGWVHEDWAQLRDVRREQLLHDATAAFRAIGVTCRGFRAPGGYRGANTAAVLSELGYLYDSSVEPDTERDTLDVHALDNGLMCLPWHWDMNDYCQYEGHPSYPEGGRAPAEVERYWSDVLDAAVRDKGLVVITVHPAVTFVDPERTAVLERLLTRAMDCPDIDVTSGEDLVGLVSNPGR